MVWPSIYPLKASGTGGLILSNRLSAWADAAMDSAYSSVAVNLYIFSFKFLNIPLALV